MKFRQPERAFDHLQNALAAIARFGDYLRLPGIYRKSRSS
jgi:hypothetical protein